MIPTQKCRLLLSLEHVREYAAFVYTLLLQSACGEPPMKRQRKHARDLQKKLHNMCTCITGDVTSISKFLYGIRPCIRPCLQNLFYLGEY